MDYIIEQHIEVLSVNEKTKWQKEVNLVSWAGRKAKFDIREWNEDHTKCSRGITLTDEEMERLKNIEISK